MYEEHDTFIQPKDEEIKIWRYMDFTKLLSLINTCSLYFSRADKLGDPFEGSLPKTDYATRNALFESISKGVKKSLSPELYKRFNTENFQKFEAKKLLTRFICINCWHKNEHESAAMWKLYLKSDEGVAIQSTYARLKRCVIDERNVYLGMVEYRNYTTDAFGLSDIYAPFLHKRKSFEHENEVRAIVQNFPNTEDLLNFTLPLGHLLDSIEHGLLVKIDIHKLIENIYVAPNAPDWFRELVETVITKYGYDFTVRQSKLNENPLF